MNYAAGSLLFEGATTVIRRPPPFPDFVQVANMGTTTTSIEQVATFDLRFEHVLRTGTDNVPFTVETNTATPQQTGTTGATQPDYGSMAVPSVWRTNRTQAAAKVDALASGGMDDYEIPAFLRKQAD